MMRAIPVAEPLITLQDVGHQFTDGFEPLRDVSFTLRRGTFTVVVGQSGIGKTTLLRILGGLLQPTSGDVQHHEPGIDVGIVFQKHSLMPWRTVAQNVALPLELVGTDPAETAARTEEMLKLVGLHGFADRFPAQLSGGMSQRVALARALVPRPQLLLLDEPFGALDALTRDRLGLELLHLWRSLSLTVFMVTHDIREAVFLADELLVLGCAPGTLVKQMPISLPRPRSRALEAAPLFHELVAGVRAAL